MRIKKIFNYFKNASKWVSILTPLLLLAVFLFAMGFQNVYSKTIDIQPYSRAKETVRSPVTIENEAETERKIRETVQSVSDRYTTVDDLTEEKVEHINEIFEVTDSVESEADKEDWNNEEKIEEIQDILSTDITEEVDNVTFRQLLQIDTEEREEGKELFIKAIEATLEDGVRTENIQSAKEEVNSTIRYSSLSDDMQEVLHELVDFSIIENSFFDVEETMDKRNEAASSVNPVVIQSGDIVVREGQVITKEMYDDLKLVGLLDNEKNVLPAVGLALFILLICGVIGYELNRLYKRNQLNSKKIAAILSISILTILMMKIISIFTDQLNHLYLITPVAAGALLIRMLIFERLSIILAVQYALFASVLFNGQIPGSLNIEAMIYFLFFQLTGIILLKNITNRKELFGTTLGMMFVNMIVIFIFAVLSVEKLNVKELLLQMGYGSSAAVLSIILTIGILPFFETGLGILSSNKLLSLANPNQRLLRKILIEAPGTYHHSVMVANLSEAACEAIGADGLLARVGAYYHDIGKTVKPQYFIENQVSIQNPHDFIKPKKSAKIIINHVTDGVKMLQKDKLPKEIVDICMQHHGTSLVQYFYHLAKEEETAVDEADFRYPGPRPQTKEIGVISICDSVEAAVRSLKEPSSEKIDSIVQSIINQKLMDGQLDNTPLTLKEIHHVREIVCESLKGIFHSRIEYPEKESI
ncbi:MAG TPA: HDIG domain-containing protein [Pseudogracilibacillus sp.]|nr:HDIG domain-containing protein [Pseudogracilibacillus sp.]